MGLHLWVADTNPAIAMALLGIRRQRNSDDCPQHHGSLGRRPAAAVVSSTPGNYCGHHPHRDILRGVQPDFCGGSSNGNCSILHPQPTP